MIKLRFTISGRIVSASLNQSLARAVPELMHNDHVKPTLLNKEPQSTVGHSTYEQIKHDIIFGNLAPGTKLKLDGLKTVYAASVSTLRETLNRLASDGFVSAEEQRGFFVTPVSKDDLSEIANLRILLECHALRNLSRMEIPTGRRSGCGSPQAAPYGTPDEERR